MSAPRDRLSMIGSRPGAEWDLAEAALLVAAEEYPGLDPRPYLAMLDQLGQRAASTLTSSEPRHRALELAQFLHVEERFDGDHRDYQDPRNSYLNDVLERRRGLPILLSLIYCEVGRRAGVAIEGVGLPGHYIVRVSGAELLLDPFHGGRVITLEECAERVRGAYGRDLPFTREMLATATPRGTLVRIIRNLKGIYAARKDLERTWRMADLILCVSPWESDELRDRGLLALRLGRHVEAADDLEAYLAARPTADDREHVVQALRNVRLTLAARN